MDSESTLKIASCTHAVSVLPMQEEGETEAAGPTLPLVPSPLVIITDRRIAQTKLICCSNEIYARKLIYCTFLCAFCFYL